MYYLLIASLIISSACASPAHPAPYAPPLPPPKPAYHPEPVYEPKPYHYAYGVQDEYAGTSFEAAEDSDGKAVSGHYSVQLPDGRRQNVKYTADHYAGYVADVSYEGHAVAPVHKPAPYHPPPPVHKPAPVHPPPPVHKPAPYHPPPPVHKPAPVYHPAPAPKPVPVYHPAPAPKPAPVYHPAPAPVYHP